MDLAAKQRERMNDIPSVFHEISWSEWKGMRPEASIQLNSNEQYLYSTFYNGHCPKALSYKKIGCMFES